MIDLDGIAGRVVALPIEAGHLQDLAAGGEGQIYYIRRVERVRPRGRPAAASRRSKRFDLKTREEETLAEGIDEFQISADRKKILYQAGGPRRTARLPPGPLSWESSTPASSPRETARSTSMRSRCGSSRERNGRRSSAKPGGSTAITSMQPTCTGPTGTPCGRKYEELPAPPRQPRTT